MRWPDAGAAEAGVGAGLGAPVVLRAATSPAALEELSAGELRQLPETGGLRRRDWLLGRAAFKQLVEGGDTSGVRFPHKCFSLTHAAGLAVAVRTDGDQAGLGVDLEGWQEPDPRVTRFFLGARELERHGAAGSASDLLRLWTVKEALFKATPDNAKVTFLDYEVVEPAALVGQAVDRRERQFRYVSGMLAEGWLTVAVCDAGV
jgi:4'-phosphopantetheinyl transferase superfamily protein